MKKPAIYANVALCSSLAIWAIKALLDYNNYTRHVELFDANGWLWYTDVLAWAKYIIPIVLVCIVIKFVLNKK
jgi:hypothetical protein